MANLTDYMQYSADTRYAPHRSRATVQLWPHQEAALTFCLAKSKSILYAGMGTGKTLFALVYLEHFEGMRLVLCPRRAMVVWAADYLQFYQQEKPFELVTLDKGTSKQKMDTIRALARRNAQAVVVVNFETAAKMPLQDIQWSAAVADEAHRMGSYTGVQSRALAKACAHIPNKVAQSGTPLTDGYERVYGIDRWLDPVIPDSPRAYPRSKRFGDYDNFIDRYCITYMLGYVKVIKGYKNLNHLSDVLRPYTLLIQTQDVVKLPPATHRTLRYTLPEDMREVYDLLADESVIKFAETGGMVDDAPEENASDDEGSLLIAGNVLTRLLRLQQMISSGELLDEDGNVRLFDIEPRKQAFRDYLGELEGAPVVVFTRFQRDVDIIDEITREVTGQPAMRLTGQVDQHEAWQAGEGQVIAVNLRAGSEGVRLTRAAHVFRWSYSYSLKDDEQSMMRVWRHGQKAASVHFTSVVAADTIDEIILRRLNEKRFDVDAITRRLGTLQ